MMHCFRVFIALQVTLSLAFWPFDPDHYPFPFTDGVIPCNDRDNPPPILSFHVHSVFDGTNKTKSQFALKLRSEFLHYLSSINSEFIEFCPFSHPNPAVYYTKICVFPPHFNVTMDAFPFPVTDPTFTSTNYAFFVPKPYLLITELWWRQHNDPSLASYMIHVCTGCEENSHTFWSMTNEGYAFDTNHSGGACCHSGPPGCFCDFNFYTISDGRCLTANYSDNTVSMEWCNVATKPVLSTWKETYYNETFIQLENQGESSINTYMCLGQESVDKKAICRKGSRLMLMSCYDRDHRLNLFNWVEGKIKALACNEEKGLDLCVTYSGKDHQLVLDDCKEATAFKRIPWTPGNLNASVPF